jgi:cell division protein FtsW (lipid II flippase)
MFEATQKRLIDWAAVFLFIYSLILTLSPAVRERSWDVDYRFAHWLAYFIWLGFTLVAHNYLKKFLPECDPYIFPSAALLSGWGLLTIWRLDESFGIRQLISLSLSMTAFIAIIIRFPHNLAFLRRYKYVLLTGGLFLTALTLIAGTNPLGYGPRLWLGCCGVYFQPSEPLKLLLVIYLAAYLADRQPIRLDSIPLLLPTTLLTGLALILLTVQRDLGTASIFIFIFTIFLFLVTGKRRILLTLVVLLAAALLIGYFFIDIIHIRVDAWLNPWTDPSGRSYQIIQSLLAIANGGIGGRGPGLGNPLLVPVAFSDFIFAAIAEETGLVGTIGLLATIWLILARGLMIALRATDRFRRFLAAGIVTYLGLQSLLIIAGNLRLSPLTGVTLPFVSHGGSSLLTSFFATAILLIISSQRDQEPVSLVDQRPYTILSGMLGIGLFVSAATSAWWTLVRGADLLDRTDNARRAIADRYVPRGEIIDRNGQPINVTEGVSGTYTRVYHYPDLAPITGYTHPIFGQAGMEAALDDYLRGLQGNPASMIWWDHLLYGTPPPGLDVRLSIDLELQDQADHILGNHPGAIILMNAETGEILTMASHPTYDPNQLDEIGSTLSQDLSAPLVNRATQGLYPVGTAMESLINGQFGDRQPAEPQLRAFYETLLLYQAPAINMPVAFDESQPKSTDLRISPLQMALAASALSNHGTIPSPRIAMAVNTPEHGPVVLPTLSQPTDVLDAETANQIAFALTAGEDPFWSHIGHAEVEKTDITWLLAGTLPDWGGTPMVLVITLEEDNTMLARNIRNALLGNLLKQ